MSILNDEQHQLLTFILTCNQQQYRPTADEVETWHANPDPSPAKYRTVVIQEESDEDETITLRRLRNQHESLGRLWRDTLFDERYSPTRGLFGPSFMENLLGYSWPVSNYMASLMNPLGSRRGPRTRRELVKPAETTIEHMVRLRWLSEDEGRLSLTDLGRALYRGHETEVNDDPALMLDAHNELAYPALVGVLASLGEGLFIDPYLTLDGLHHILTTTTIDRVLVKKRVAENAAFSIRLGSADRDIEVRASTELHDRLALPDKGGSHMLGTSLNGVGKRAATFFAPLPKAVDQGLREHYEEVWESATQITPTTP